jgi:hypothetical protein
MFSRPILILIVALSAAVDSAVAHARAPGGSGRKSYSNVLSRPTVSPYLNLLRPDASPAQNYYTLVRPQVDQRNATLQQGSEIDSLRREVKSSSAFRGAARSQMSPTGHHAGFLNHSRFYQSAGASARSR